MPQYFAKSENIKGNNFFLDESESRHIVKSARKKIGDEIKIFDGKGKRFLAEIKSAEKTVSGKIKKEIPSENYRLNLIVSFALVSKDAVEKILDYCSQVGVSAFEPLICERNQFKAGNNWDIKKERFKKIILSASKQSERGFLPDILSPVPFKKAFDFDGPVFIASPEKVKNTSSPKPQSFSRAKILTGPEGGFSEREKAFAKEKGAFFIKLAKNILRSELAAPIAAAAILNKNENENIF